jgi:hypothetical protein
MKLRRLQTKGDDVPRREPKKERPGPARPGQARMEAMNPIEQENPAAGAHSQRNARLHTAFV